MSRYANPGPVHLSGVGGVCWPFWGDLGREPSRPAPLRYPRHVLTGGGDHALRARRPVCLEMSLPASQLGEQSFFHCCLRAPGSPGGTLHPPQPLALPADAPVVVVTGSPAPGFCSGGSCPSWSQTHRVGAALFEYWFFSKLGI